MATWEDGLISVGVAVIFARAAFVSLIQERDRVLARNIRDACLGGRSAGSTRDTSAVVAVIGMAHLAGVREALMSEAPPPDPAV